MAKVNGREDALLNAYLNRYQTAQASNVGTGRSTTRKAQQQGSAIMNATDKTLPVLHNSYTETLNNIVQGANLENSLNNDILNRQMKLAQAKFDAANDLYQQQQKAQQYAAKKAAKAAKSSGKSSGKGGSTTGTGSDTESAASLDSLFGGTASTGGNAAGSADTARNKGGNYDPKRTNAERNASARARYDGSEQEKSDIKYRAQQKRGQLAQMLKDKQAAANAGANKGKPSGNSYAERQSAAQPAQSRAVTRGGKVIGSSYAAAGSVPSAAETQAAKNKRNDYKSRKEDIAAALKKLQSDADYRAELATPGRKLTSAEVAAVNQYEKSTKNTGFSGLKRVFETAANKEGLSQEDYAKKTAAMNAELNQNSALRGKAQMNGAGQTAQAFTAGLYDSVPFLTKSVDKLTDIANKTGSELPQLSNAIEGAKSYDQLAAAAGTLVGKGMQYDLFNTSMAGTPLAQTMGKAGNAVVGQAQKIPVLGDVLGAGAGDALGRILTDTTADLALDTLPSLVNDVSEGKSAGEIAGNTAKNIAGNVAMNAVPEIGGAVFNRLKGTAGDAAQDALKQADNSVQDVQSAAPARNIVQPEANGTTGLAAQIQQMNTPDAANRSALNTLDELRGQANLNGAQEKEAEQLRRAVLQRQQEIGDEAKLALQNTDSLPIDAQRAAGYNEVNGGVQNDNLGAGVRADVPLNADTGAGYEPQPGGVGSGLAGQTGTAGLGSTADGNGRGVQGPDAPDAGTVAEWARSITGKDRRSVYTRRIEDLYGQLQSGATRESMADEAKDIATGIVKESSFAEPVDEATATLRDYFKSTPIRLDEQAAGDILYTSGLKNIQQYNFQNGTNFSTTSGLPYDTALMELADMGTGVSGSGVDDLLSAVAASNRGALVDTDQAAATADYYRDMILDGPTGRQAGTEDFTDWLEVQGFDSNMPDYTRRVYDRMFGGTDTADAAASLRDSRAQSVAARPLNGSESVPAHAVGAESTQYDRREVLNQDYANQRGMTSGLDDAHLENLKTENTHQIWTDAEAKQQAEDDLSTYIQQAGGDENKALDNAMQDLRNKEHWNKGDSATADEIRDRLKTQFAKTQPGTPEYYAQKARYEAWNQKRSQVRSEVAQTMQSFHGDASERINTVSKPITENWAKNNPVQDEKLKSLSDELAKLKDELRERDIADMEREAMQGAFGNGGSAAKHTAGDMDAEFGQMLKDNGIPTHEERVANFSDADKEKYKTATEEAYNSIVARVKKLCEKNNVKIDDDAAKTIAGKIMNGDNAESYYNSLIMQAAGISDLSIDEMEMVDDLYSTAAKLPDGKEKYQMEAQAVGIMAKHLPAKSWFERFDNIRYLAMLGNPTTHGKNIIGNILMKGLSDTKDEVAAAMQLVTTKKADRTKALYVPQGMKKAASKWIDENHYAEVVKDGGKYNLDSGLDRARSTYGQTLVGRALQKASDFNSNLLDKEDEIFVKMGATHSLANILTARGYDASIFTKTDEASQRVLLDALETAKRDAKDVTFHTETALTRGMEAISKWGDKKGDLGEKIKYCIGQGLLPFAKTPSNILKTAAEYNPVGATFEAGYRAYHHEGSAAVTDALAKGVVGSGVMAVGYWLAHEGFLTGTLDEDTKNYDEMLGKQEYSVNIPGVGSYSLDWAAPAIVPLMIGANLEQGGYNLDAIMQDPNKLDKAFGEVIDVFTDALDPIQNMTMMQGINNTLENIRYSDDNAAGGIGSLALNLGTGYLQQFVPTALSKAAKTVDETRRSTYGGGSSALERNKNYLLRSTMNKIPGLSKESEPYIDQWGREEASLDGTGDDAEGMFLRGLYNFSPLSPGYFSAENITPVDEYLQGLYGSTNDKHDFPEKAKNYLSVDNENYYMTPEEKTEYAKTSGQTAYDLIDELRQNSMFLQLPEDQQSALVQDAYTVAKTAGGVAAVGDGVSGVNAKEYEAYRDGGAEGFRQYVLMKNATDLVRDEKRETSGNDNADLNTVETWDTLYSQFGDDAVSNFVDGTDDDSTVHNISNLAGDKAVTAYMQAYSAVAKTLENGQTPDKFTVGYGMQKYGLSGDDFARAYLAAYYKKNKNGKYPEKGGSYADKAGAEIYQSYGADALRDWVNYRATIPDTNGNGKADKGEAVARLKEMDLTNEMRRAYLAKTNKQWGKKNPF